MDIDIYTYHIGQLKSQLISDIDNISYRLSHNIGNKKSQIGALAKLKDSYICLESVSDKVAIAWEKYIK